MFFYVKINQHNISKPNKVRKSVVDTYLAIVANLSETTARGTLVAGLSHDKEPEGTLTRHCGSCIRRRTRREELISLIRR